jgi:DNA polymerase I-like protein with 3'-5' exonuclease and polymerase domains
VTNIFGYHMRFFSRIQGTVFNEAGAAVPQSTVGCIINRIWMNIHEQLPYVQVLLQVHDSLVGQFPTEIKETAVKEILRCSEVVLPYADPLVIPADIKLSDRSWGDCG